MQSKLRMYAVLAVLALSTALMPSPASGQEPADIGFTRGDLEFELFLNRMNITVDRVILEEMIEDGDAVKIDDEVLFRSSADERLYVLIGQEENVSEGFYPYHDSGATFTIGIPADRRVRSVEMDSLDLELDGNGYLGPDIRWFLHDRGFRVSSLEGELVYIRDGTMISFASEGNVVKRVLVNTTEGATSSLEDTVRGVLSLLDENEDPWDAEGFQPMINEMTVYETDISRYDIDWTSVVEGELEHLTGTGLIKGLSGPDIMEISREARPGLSGRYNRILEFKGIMGEQEGEWTSYLATTFPLESDGVDEGPSVSSADVPGEGPVNTPEGSSYLPVILSVVMIIFLIMAFILTFKARAGNLMKNAYRKQIMDVVREEPGIHFREIMRKVDIKQGVLSYHLNKLEKAELIRSRQDGMHRRFFLFNSKADLTLNLSDLQKDIMIMVLNDPGISQSNISRGTGRNLALIHYHIRFLKDAGLIWMDKERGITKLFLTGVGSNTITG